MYRRLVSSLILLAATVASTPAVHASPLHFPGKRPNASLGRGKTVSLKLRNASSTPMEIRIGSEVTTLGTGELRQVRLAEGTRITSNTPTADRAAGSLLLEVGADLKNATVSIR